VLNLGTKRVIISKEQLQECLDLGLTRIKMAERFKCGVVTLDRNMKANGLEYLKSSHFNSGEGNPAKRPSVRRKIANTVATLWEDGFYDNRIDGMSYKTGFDDPNYKGHKWDYRDYLAKYQDINVCAECGRTIKDSKIDVHHVDENHENWLITNLKPLCVKCHQTKHYKSMKTPYVTIGIKSHFDSAHNLLNYKGKCSRIHGHRYFYEIKIKDRINRETGMVMDFKVLKKLIKEGFEEVVDHEYLNYVLPFNTTAENMVVWMFEFLSKRQLVKGIQEISLWETPECITTFTYKDLLRSYMENKLDCFTTNFEEDTKNFDTQLVEDNLAKKMQEQVFIYCGERQQLGKTTGLINQVRKDSDGILIVANRVTSKLIYSRFGMRRNKVWTLKELMQHSPERFNLYIDNLTPEQRVNLLNYVNRNKGYYIIRNMIIEA